jgi:hypothetical protein
MWVYAADAYRATGRCRSLDLRLAPAAFYNA